jgi:hypothetical protein
MGCVAGQSTSISVYMLVLLYFFLFSFKFAPLPKNKVSCEDDGSFDSSSLVRSGRHWTSWNVSISIDSPFLKRPRGAPPTYILAPKRRRETKTKNRKTTPYFIFCYMRANARLGRVSEPRREKRGPTRGRVKRYLQEKTLELTADFMVNWIRFETSVD